MRHGTRQTGEANDSAAETGGVVGDLALAQWLSFSANKDNGLRRTNEEKQEAVKHALLHPLGEKKSDRDIAKWSVS